jgi:hypothetical protein
MSDQQKDKQHGTAMKDEVRLMERQRPNAGRRAVQRIGEFQ